MAKFEHLTPGTRKKLKWLAFILLILVLLMTIWPVLNQEGRPMKTLGALFRLSVLQQPYVQLDTSPELYLVKDHQAFHRSLQLTEIDEDRMGAMHYFKSPRGRRCALAWPMTRHYLVWQLESKC